MRTPAAVGLLLLNLVTPAAADDARKVEGRVVNREGKPVSDASVDYFWRANGSTNDPNGKPINFETQDGNKLWWGRVGQMEPFRTVKSKPDGHFSIDVPDSLLYAYGDGCGPHPWWAGANPEERFGPSRNSRATIGARKRQF